MMDIQRLLTILFLALLPMTPVSAQEKIRAGISVPLTGPGAPYGHDILNVLTFLNEAVYQGAFEFTIEDDRCDPRQAVSVAHKLINLDRIKYVLGLPCSGAVLAAAPVYEKAKVFTFVIGGSPAISSAGDLIFRTRPSDQGAAEVLFDYVAEHHKTAALIAEETDYAQDLKKAFAARNRSGSFGITEIDFISGTADFRPIVTALKHKNLGAFVVLPQSEETLALIVKQIRELGLHHPVYGSVFPGSATFIKAAGDQAEGIIFSTLPSNEEVLTTAGKELFEKFTAAHGPLNSVHYMFYCGHAQLQSLHAAVRSGQSVRSYLYQTAFDGIAGRYYFDSSGDIMGLPYVLRRIAGGRVASIEGRPSSLHE